jgi:hypothetical protein
VAAGIATAAVVVLVAADQLPPAAIAVPAIGLAAGGALGRWRRARAWPLDPFLSALVALAFAFAALPDTEGPTVLGAALVPVTVTALVRRSWWRGAAAGAGPVASAAAIVLIGVDADGGRGGALAVTAVGAAAGAVLVVVLARVLVPRPPLTSERERPVR